MNQSVFISRLPGHLPALLVIMCALLNSFSSVAADKIVRADEPPIFKDGFEAPLNIDQCSTGEHDCDLCSQDCNDTFDPDQPPGWTCTCKAGFFDDGAGCSFEVTSPPAVTFDTSGVHDISLESNIPNRACADAPSYSVTSLSSSSATLNEAPTACCLNRGDEVMLVNLQGANVASDTVGNWELLEVANVSGSTVGFKSPKNHFYGSGASDDSNIGTAAGQQRVMLLRVPVYGNVAVADDYPNTTLTAPGWDGLKGGVLAARMNALDLDGVIDMAAMGYSGGEAVCGVLPVTDRAQQGESISGPGLTGGDPANWPLAAAANNGGGGGGCFFDFESFPGGGGGYGTAGATITVIGGGGDACGWDAEGGHVYGGQDLSSDSGKVFLGSGGGGGGDAFDCAGKDGGAGGGIILFLISGDLSTTLNARIYANGEYSGGAGDGTGGGSGGSIYIEVANVSVEEPSQPIYARGGNQSGPPPLATGGDGRIHFDCSGTCIDADDSLPQAYKP
jgi:hypothetical protein